MAKMETFGIRMHREDRSKKKMEKDEERERSNNQKTRLTARFTRITLVGPTFMWAALLLTHLNCLLSEGLVIDPKLLLSQETHTFAYCLGSGESITFLDPFDPSIFNSTPPSLDGLFWAFSQNNKTERLLYKNSKNETLYLPRVRKHQFWGIEVTNVTRSDAGLYEALFITVENDLVDYELRSMMVNIRAAPVLATEQLVLTTQEGDDSVNVTCGEIASLGDPPIKLQLKTSDGHVLNDVVAQGTLSVTLPKNQDTNGFVCEVDWNASLAASCLTENEKKAWHAATPFQSSSHVNNKGAPSQLSPSLVQLSSLLLLLAFLQF